MRNAQTFLCMETPPLWVGTRLLRMETPLRGRSGGHTGAAPTISRVAPCPKVAGEQVRRWTKTREVAWQRGLMEVGRGGACVPARVAP